TSRCNSQCIICEHKDMKRVKQDMPMELYKKIIKECSQYKKLITNLSLSFMGEPLLDENIFKKIKLAKEQGIGFVSFICNGSLLTKEKAKYLIDSGIDSIVFSVDGAYKASYEKIRVGLNYEQVTNNIKTLINLKKELRSKKPTVSVDMVQTKFNKGEIELFKAQWQGLADEVMVRPLHVWGGEVIDKDLLNYSRNTLSADKISRRPCFYLWKSMFISQDGKVALCCVDAECESGYGNITTSSIKEIWQGEQIKKLRKLHLCGEFDKIPLCGRCNFYLAKEVPWWWV
ncbi:MAG: radical SAM/SPASM domain-containing protein, partial [Nanoarchaeota archaeon]|nr:radical SAM/SPASM domain-containing protein [Nanoarchaeota archaeon]